jgi:hypothetical protein
LWGIERDIAGYRRFESVSLQRGVWCEPDFILAIGTVAETSEGRGSSLIATIGEAGGPAFDLRRADPGLTRRMTGYKRPHPLLDYPDRLVSIERRQPFQVVFAGKAVCQSITNHRSHNYRL